MWRIALVSLVSLVSLIAARPQRADAISVTLDCGDSGTQYLRFAGQSILFTVKSCTDEFMSPAGFPPTTYGEHALCSEYIRVTANPWLSTTLTCDWDSARNVDRRIDRSFESLYCFLSEQHYGFENDFNVGYLVVKCADRRTVVRALGG